MLTYSNERYDKVSIFLHWAMAILFILMISLGWYMSGLDKQDASRGNLYFLHKSTGILMLELALIRVVWMFTKGGLRISGTMSEIEKNLVIVSHISLYGFIILIPFSGYSISSTGGYPVSFFGLFDIPLLIDKSKVWFDLSKNTHYYLAYISAGMIALHIIGGLKHQVKYKD